MTRGRALAAWALLTLFGMLLGCGLIEVGVRALHFVPDRFWEPDPLLGWRHIAGKVAKFWTREVVQGRRLGGWLGARWEERACRRWL